MACRLAKARHRRRHSRPKPSEFMIASLRRSAMTALERYEGSSSVLKQVCDVGSFRESVPSLWTIHL
jgi:hypothetical protein